MIAYLIKRILLMVPTLFVVAMITFFLGKMAPGDPVEQFLELSYSPSDYEREARRLQLDKPVFYFEVTTQAYPDTLYKFINPQYKNALRQLTAATGDWSAVEAYTQALQRAETHLADFAHSLPAPAKNAILHELRLLRFEENPFRLSANFNAIQDSLSAIPDFKNQPALQQTIEKLHATIVRMEDAAIHPGLARPKIIWYGWDNQFHYWLTGVVAWDFGRSYADGRPVGDRVRDALFWTLIINVTAIILAFGIGIPVGVWSAVNHKKKADRYINLLLFMLYSLPVFWIATLLLVFFTTPEYGLDWFPSIGLGEVSEHTALVERLTIRAGHLFLPVVCLTYPSIAFIARQMRGAMLQELTKDYIRTARAKGLSRRKIIWDHAFRNALFPMLTLFSAILPASIAGSVVVEVVFNIPGMGKLLVDAIFQNDFPVVYAVMLLGAILTMVGILLSDILYSVFDPRIRFQQK